MDNLYEQEPMIDDHKVKSTAPVKVNVAVPPVIPRVAEDGKVEGMPEVQLDGWINSDQPDETFNMGPDYCRPSNRKPYSGYAEKI